MIRRGWISAGLIFLAVGFAVAAARGSAVEGRWQGSSNTANGSITITYNFEVKGQVLTGNAHTPFGSQTITDGNVSGDKISFKTTINGNVIEHQGTVRGDTIQLKNNGPFGEFDITLKRVPSENKSPQQ